MCMGRPDTMGAIDNQLLPDGHDDEAMNRTLREAVAAGHLAEFQDECSQVVDELRAVLAAGDEVDEVDMSLLVEYLNAHGVVTTYFSGGSTRNGVVSRPHILFPHLAQLQEALQLFETLARHLDDDDMVQAIYNPVDEERVGEGERMLHGEQVGFKTSGGRIVSFDNTWSMHIDSVEYERYWVDGLRAFDRPIPDRRPVGEHAWRFSVCMPARHAAALVHAAGEILSRNR